MQFLSDKVLKPGRGQKDRSSGVRFSFNNPALLCRPICRTWQRPGRSQTETWNTLTWSRLGPALSPQPATSQSFLRPSCSKFVPANNSSLKMLWHEDGLENDNLFAPYIYFNTIIGIIVLSSNSRNYSKWSLSMSCQTWKMSFKYD